MASPAQPTPPVQTKEPPDPLSLWEVLGDEYCALSGTTKDKKHSELLDAYFTARRVMEGKQKEKGEAESRGIEKVCRDAEASSEQATQDYKKTERALVNHLIKLFHERKRNALCFSGGGIRSSSFCLGVLQALARHTAEQDTGVFYSFDYLSTVSGGGYTGGWLSNWIKQENSAKRVVEELSKAWEEKLDPEPKPLLYIRNFVSYLNPKLGLLSADSWTLVSTILRNVILNWLVLLPLLAAVLALPRLVYAGLLGGAVWGKDNFVLNILLVISGIGAAVATAYIVLDLPTAINARKTQVSYLRYCLAPVFISSLGLTCYWAWYMGAGGQELAYKGPIEFVMLTVAAGLLIALVLGYVRKVPRRWGWIVGAGVSTLAAAGFAAAVGYYLAKVLLNSHQHSSDDIKLFSWLAVPGALMIIGVMQFLTVGLTSKLTEDEDREWWARSMAWLLLTVLLWVSLAGVVLNAEWLLARVSLGISGLATTALGAIASRLGKSAKTKSGRRSEEGDSGGKLSLSAIPANLALKLVLPAFLILLVIFLASVNEALSLYLGQAPWLSRWLWLGRTVCTPSFGNECLLFALLVVLGLGAAIFVNVNKFSLHAMYRLRLIRTFLGASNEHRRPNPFTGFDPEDNLAMSQLPNQRPMHVVNMALNLVKGDKLAWQQRKAESFTVTRLHSGSCRVGYQPSRKYGKAEAKGGITLGGAITISGAAASPNMGYHSSPLVTIIMTLFNARLGVWLANPGKGGRRIWDREGPTFGVRPFIDEAFGLTTDTNAWVYLSDGGHFENLGLYEMVLRRCRNIVVVDASADSDFNYEDLGNAIRKIRIDMGIPIEFPDQPHIPKSLGEEGPHWAVGEIQYSCVDKKDDGTPWEDGSLLYIKPSINGNEPKDILAYSKLQPAFPHQSTADQWFDEPQFESYRRLGFHSVEELLEFSTEICTLDGLIERACIANGVTPPGAAD
jgi:hypothetical protein